MGIGKKMEVPNQLLISNQSLRIGFSLIFMDVYILGDPLKVPEPDLGVMPYMKVLIQKKSLYF